MRFARLLAEGWDVHLLHRDGIFDEPGIAELSDTVLCARVHPPPRSMRRRLPRMGLVLGLLRALARRPLGVTAALARDADPRRRYQRASLLALGADLVHIPSAAEAEAWLDLQPLLEAPIRIGDGDVASTRDEPELHVLAVGPLVWELGFEHLLQAVRQTIDRGVACRCRIVGSGEHETAIAFARRQLGLDRVVDLVVTGPTSPSLGAHFAWADVAAHAAVTTSRPYWLREAQAAGLAIVTTEAVPGVAATTVSRRDAERLADALVGFAASPSIAARLTAAPAAIDADEARVTILLPVRAYHEAFLGAALDAVFRQTSPRWRLLIVDDGAEGPAFERLTAAALRDPRVRRVSGEGHGLAAALNTGYRAARTEFVASLFADDLWADDAVEVLTRAIERSPEIDFFHSSRRFIDEQGRALSSVYRARDRVGVADFVTGSPVKHLLCVRRSAALAIGGVDESVGPIAADDYDFPWTMAEAGARFAAIPECLYLFRDHREVFRLTTHVPRNEHVRGLRRIFRKHGVGRLRAEWRLWTAKQSYLRQCLYRSRFDHWLKRALGADPRRGARELYT